MTASKSTRRTSRTARTLSAVTTVGLLAAGALVPATAADESTMGRFNAPFVEPVIYDFQYDEDGRKVAVGDATETDDKCIDDGSGERLICKPAAGSLALLPDGRIIYWSALEATENVELGAVPEFGLVAENDQTRVLELTPDGPVWTLPFGVDGGAVNDPKPLLDGALIDQGGETNADGALFGSDQVFLADGRLLAASGTDYYNEFGAIELEGLKATRIFDPETNAWTASGDLNIGRWYPTLVTLANGDVMAFSGVTKLIKPVYADEDPTESGTNVVHPEVYDYETGTWELLPATSDRSLPLYPRMRLLPNGNILFDTAGQTWDPAGYSYSEALWNIAATFDPRTGTWNDHGIPGADGSTGVDVAYRGSGSTVMLPLRPNAEGAYDTVELLNSGGHPGTSPGTYVGTAHSRVTEVAIAADGSESVSHRSVGSLNQGRWYGHSTLLPTGEVFLTSGADVDHVIAPGSERPVTVPELYDPVTETWTQVASQTNARTYHNSAMLLPDGTVLVGGHNPIPTGYGSHMTVPGNAPNDGRDPSFEIYEPPYLFRGERPQIKKVDERITLGSEVTIELTDDAQDITEVVLVRHRAETHLIDGDQRSVVLPIVETDGKKVTVSVTDNGSVLPAGPYMLFVNRGTDDGPIPSEADLVSVELGDTGDIVGTQSLPAPSGAVLTIADEVAPATAPASAPGAPLGTPAGIAVALTMLAAAAAVVRGRRTV